MNLLWSAANIVAEGPPGYPGHWGWHHGLMGSGWGIFMILLMLLFWGLVIGGIILIVRLLFPTTRLTAPENPLEILKRRYARGEIQKAEFEEKKKDLAS